MCKRFTPAVLVLGLCWSLELSAQDSTTTHQPDSLSAVVAQGPVIPEDSLLAFLNHLSYEVSEHTLTGRGHTQLDKTPGYAAFAAKYQFTPENLHSYLYRWAQSPAVVADSNTQVQASRYYYLRRLQQSSEQFEQSALQQEVVLPARLKAEDLHDVTIAPAIANTVTAWYLAGNSANEAGNYVRAVRLYRRADSLLSFGNASLMPAPLLAMRSYVEELLAAALYEEGRRIGDTEGYLLLAQGLSLERALLVRYSRSSYPEEWARTKSNLGTILEAQGELIEGGDSLYKEAHDAFLEATMVYTRGQYPQDWARMKNNIGVIQSKLGKIEEAITAFREALDIYTQKDHAADWALTQYNIGNMYQFKATEAKGGEGLSLFQQSVAAYKAALTVFTAKNDPDEYGWVQHKLGVSLFQQGRRIDGRNLLTEAVEAFRAALTVRTKEGSPTAWASTQYNLGTTLWEENSRAAGGNVALLDEAVKAFEAALTIYNKKDYPDQWFNTQNSLGLLYEQKQQWANAIKHFENIRDIEPMYATQKVNELRKRSGH
ncbi:tetratricopeptide repeat protein [Paraflavitalea pollutisoli]|uniref:tetratricopeptide repeat protein n=1 Tax=Paraflavitalea pollutisoli TaxID=3034143 RepID=UPI0023EDE1D1|nr:tetratricopeptide repeat protein [Paraflavitalea sp. H1-2-19X]